MSSAQADYIALFDKEGNKLAVSKRQLRKIEDMTFNNKFFTKLFGLEEGVQTFWLVSNRKGATPMLLQLSRHVYRDEHGKMSQSSSYCTNGIASYSHFDIDTTVDVFEQDTYADHLIPANVADLARKYVKFNGTVSPNPREIAMTVRTLSAAKMRKRMSGMSETISGLTDTAADRRIGVFELFLILHEHVEEKNVIVGAYCMVPATQWLKLRRLMSQLANQL